MLILAGNHVKTAAQDLSGIVKSTASSGSQPKPTARRLDTIDALRAFSALGVVVTHIAHHGTREGNVWRLIVLPLDFGCLGVTCFLVLSGFCIHLAASARPGGLVAPRWGAFWKRRMYRLYPAYVVAGLLSYAVYTCLGPAVYSTINQIHLPGYDAAIHALMIHNLFQRFPFSLGNGVFWTLGMEEQLYALYALYVVLRRRYSAVALAVLALSVSLLWRFLVVAPFGSRSLGSGPLALGSWWTWPFGWWFCWVLGALAAEAYVSVIKLPEWCFSLRIAAAAAVIAMAISQLTLGQVGYSRFIQHTMAHSVTWWVAFQLVPQCSELAFALCIFLCINRLVRAEHAGSISAVWRHSAKIGRMSYSLYLIHMPVLMVLETFLLSGESAAVTALRYTVFVPTCLAFGWIYFRGIERHFATKRSAV